MRTPCVLALLIPLTLALSIPGSCSDLALVHAKIYTSPTEPPIEDGTILIHNGRIRAVGPSTKIKLPRFARAVMVLNCQNRVVTPGFWNSHIHILTPGLLHAGSKSSAEISAQLDQMLTRWGFTTVFDIASVLNNTNNIRRRIAAGEVRGPEFSPSANRFTQEVGLRFT